MRENSLICLGAGVAQMALIREAKKQNLKVVAIDRNKQSPGALIADEFINVSTYDSDVIVTELKKLSDGHVFVGLAARVSGPALLTAAAIAEQFNLRGMTMPLAKLATEKSSLQQFLKSNGFNVFDSQRIKDISECERLVFPVIVKPDLPIVGKKSVKVVNNVDELTEAITAASIASANKFVEVEKYMEGIDVSCQFKLSNGKVEIIAMWDELVGLDEHKAIYGIGVSLPSVVEETSVKQKIKEITEKFGALFSDVSAVLILSFRVDASGNVYIIELHADLGGDLIADVLLPVANSKFDFFAQVIDFVVGNQGQSIELEFEPTALIYNNGRNDIFQQGTVLKNLSAAEKLFRGINPLGRLPQHKAWLQLWQK